MQKQGYVFVGISLFLVFSTVAQTDDQPIIANFGQVYSVADADYQPSTDKALKVVFDVAVSPKDSTAINPRLETAARFLNMHTVNGFAKDSLQVALVVHNMASKDMMHNQAYRKRYGVDNPNAELIKALMVSGTTEVIFCGQSSRARKIPKEDTIRGVQLALSAMTALLDLQNKGYRPIKF